MRRKADESIDVMRDRLLSGPGHTDTQVRRAAFAGTDVPESLAALVDKVHREAYKVTDDDVEAARAAGWSDSQLFEVIVAAAVGAGLRRRDACDRLLAEHPGDRR